MTTLLATVLASSVLGSLHCAAMCGPLQGLYLDATLAGGARWRRPLAHAAGRLGAYVTLGAIAGGVGAAVDLAGALADVQRAAMIVAGAMLVAWGALALASALVGGAVAAVAAVAGVAIVMLLAGRIHAFEVPADYLRTFAPALP